MGMYHGLHFGLLHTSNLFPIKIISAGGLECLMLQIDASDKNFFSDYFFIVSSAIFACHDHLARHINPQFKRLFYDYFKTKQQEFIHPLILSPTLHEKKNKFVFHLVLLGQTIEIDQKNQSKKHTQKKTA